MRSKLRAVLVAGSVLNVAFDDVLLAVQEQAGDGAEEWRAFLVVVTL